MRFMMLLIPCADAVIPSERDVAEMGKYNEVLVNAGVLLAFDALQPQSQSRRVRFSTGKITVAGAPFGGGEEIRACWRIEVATAAEAVKWATRCPARVGDVIEVRGIERGFSPEILTHPYRAR